MNRKSQIELDFFVENRPLTKEEENQISEYITAQKMKKQLKENSNARTSKTKQKV